MNCSVSVGVGQKSSVSVCCCFHLLCQLLDEFAAVQAAVEVSPQ